jgi:hypothetical protein
MTADTAQKPAEGQAPARPKAEPPPPSSSDPPNKIVNERPAEPAAGDGPQQTPPSDTDQPAEQVQEATSVPRSTHEAFYGYSFEQLTTHGPTVYGDHGTAIANIFTDGRDRRPSRSQRLDIAHRVATYAPTGSKDELVARLRSRRVVCLSGVAGTGRTTTACVALAEVHGPAGVHEIQLPPGVDADSLTAYGDLPAKGAGHLLRCTGEVPATMVRLLEAMFRARQATLVLLQETSPTVGDGHGGLVEHRAAEPEQIFASQLRHLLRDPATDHPQHAGSDDLDSYIEALLVDERLREALHQTYRPREIVDIAEQVAKRRPRPTELAEVLAASQPERRRRAEKILLFNRGGGALRHHRSGQYERAVRVAYAMFNGESLGLVFDAAGFLLDELDAEHGGPAQGRSPLEHEVGELLGETLGSDWTDARLRQPTTPGAFRTAALRDHRMTGAILDVVWHDLDNTRPAVLRWLKRMATDRRAPMRWRAATAAGFLTHLDFDVVCNELIDGWAGSGKMAVRQVAAWATTLAATGGLVTPRVLGRVHEWGTSRSAYLRDTAVRFHAGAAERQRPGVLGPLGWVLADLYRCAGDPLQQGRPTVAMAVDAVYRTGEARSFLASLATWVRAADPNLQLHAARATLRLTGRDTPAGAPELLVRAAAGDLDMPDLNALWWIALLRPETARRTWSVLGRWVDHADTDSTVTDAMSAVLAALSATAPMRRRLQFYVPRLWRLNHDNAAPPAWAIEAIGGI